MTTKDPEPKMMVNRRGAMRLGAAAVGTAAGVGAYGKLGGVQQAQAIPPVAIGAAAVGASAAVGWALREYEVVGSDDPPEGLTLDALHDRIYDTVRARESTNSSTFVDNQNILEGIEHTAYGDGKLAAIEALNEEESQDNVYEAAESAANAHFTTVMRNFLKGWNEAVFELENLVNTVKEHPDTELADIFTEPTNGDHVSYDYDTDDEEDYPTNFDPIDVELPDGTSMDVHVVNYDDDGSGGGAVYTPTEGYDAGQPERIVGVRTDAGDVDYMSFDEWNPIWEEMDQMATDVSSDLSLWVEEVYNEVQAGELDTADLLTPRELAEMTADEEDFNQAISDLMALNVAVDLEREAEVHIPDLDATVYGQIATTGDGSLTTGTVDPSDDDAFYYLTYDVSEGSGEWGAHETGIDGGTVTFTSEPWPETVYYIDTVAGETAEVQASDFDEDEEEEIWTYDVSDQLEDSIVDIEAVEYYATTEETQYETVQLTDAFEIVTFRDSDGEEHDEANFTRTETHDDENYITQEEWEKQQERHEELIEKFEDAQGGGFNPFDGQGVSEWARDNPAKAGGGVGIGYLILRALSI